MSNEIAVIKTEVAKKANMDLIAASLGKPVDDPDVMRFISGAMMVISDKRELLECNPVSLAKCLIHAANIRLPVDNRNLAYLVPFNRECQLMPSYKGYIHKVKLADPTAEFTVALVFMGDTFEIHRGDGNASYNHQVKNPFEDRMDAVVGAYCFIKTATGSFIETMSRAEIEKVRNTSKMRSGATWSTWAGEMVKKAVIRRACKVRYIEAVAELDAIDAKLFDHSSGKLPETFRRVDTSNVLSGKEQPVAGRVQDTTGEPITESQLKAAADRAAKAKNSKKKPEPIKPEPSQPAAPAELPPAEETQQPELPNNEGPTDTDKKEELKPGQYTTSGLIAKYEPSNGNRPARFYITGEYHKTFDKEVEATLAKHYKDEQVVEIKGHVEKAKDPKYPDSNIIDEIAVIYG